MKYTKIVYLLIFLLSIPLSARAQQPTELEKILTKQDELAIQYNDLALKILYPAGLGPQFDSFRLKNPKYLISSYSRSRTADFIRRLLVKNKGPLQLFKECGLSQGGEYFCRNSRCGIHGERVRAGDSLSALSLMEFNDGAKALAGVVAGLVLFVLSVGIGHGVIARIEKNIAKKEKQVK